MAETAAVPRLALALDVAEPDEALALAAELAPWFPIAKVGLELFCRAGPVVVEQLASLDLAVFLDLKLHDIPTTCRRAAAALARLPLSYLTAHASGGETMLAAVVDGLAPSPALVLGVTVLTSEPAAPGVVAARARAAAAAGCAGVVCAAGELAEVAQAAPGLLRVVPGLRPARAPSQDQLRVATPAEAAAGGADVLVVGRAVTGAADRRAAAAELAASLL